MPLGFQRYRGGSRRCVPLPAVSVPTVRRERAPPPVLVLFPACTASSWSAMLRRGSRRCAAVDPCRLVNWRASAAVRSDRFPLYAFRLKSALLARIRLKSSPEDPFRLKSSLVEASNHVLPEIFPFKRQKPHLRGKISGKTLRRAGKREDFRRICSTREDIRRNGTRGEKYRRNAQGWMC